MLRRSRFALLILLALLAPAVAACSSDTTDSAKETVESAKDDAAQAADDTEVRAQAEALRVSLKANDTADEEGVRSVDAIDQAVEDLPGDPEVSGVDDGDGDGLDDDGKVQLTVGDSSACVTLPESGEEIDVTDGDC
ncbi:MAG: hypothetical protein R2702_06410 [Acidimicrobiales bacterium]